jgi:cytochrome c oxidase subunit 2
MMANLRKLAALAGLSAVLWALATGPSAAQSRNWQLGMQPPASPSAEAIVEFHNLLMWIITLISIFVLGLLLWVMYRYSEKRNPTPGKTTHNTVLEIVWTAVPVMILVLIAIPSFKLLYAQEEIVDIDMTIKAIGRQWYWSYEYPDHGNFAFDANMVPDDELQEGQPRLLATDNAVVLPVDTRVRILVTASDVIHNLAMPALGLKMDAVPGRINETWVSINQEGTYYGQCSEICGTGHSYMPIMIKAVSKAEFEEWVEKAKVEFAARREAPAEPVKLAEAARAAAQ